MVHRAASRGIVLLPKLEPADRLKRPDVENEDRVNLAWAASRPRNGRLASPPFPRAQSPEPRPAKTPIAGATCAACRLRATICRLSVPCSELRLGSNLYRLGPQPIVRRGEVTRMLRRWEKNENGGCFWDFIVLETLEHLYHYCD